MSECVNCGATDAAEGGIVVGKAQEGGDSLCNVCRADHLYQETTLSKREADVAALKMIGHSHGRIAGLIGIEKSTVDEYSSRINQKRRLAEQTEYELRAL